MDHPLAHLAHDLIESTFTGTQAFGDGDSSVHEACLDERHSIRHHIAGLSPRDLCRLTDSLADVAASALHALIDGQAVTYAEAKEVLRQALSHTHDSTFIKDVANGPGPVPLGVPECACKSAAAPRLCLDSPPDEPGIVLDNPCCNVCGEWAVVELEDFSAREAAWWADWHIDAQWAPFWHQAGWTPSDVRHLLRKEPRYRVAVQWARTGMDPRDALEHACNGADPRDFMAFVHKGGTELERT